MKNAIGNCRQRKAVLFALALPLMFSGSACAGKAQDPKSLEN